VLAVQRPDEPDEELPGVWGLPATTLQTGESDGDGIRRLGREKLGVDLTALHPLGSAKQQRADYTLTMTVYEASMTGEPSLRRAPAGTSYAALSWRPADVFKEAAERGSLCCELFVSSSAGLETAKEGGRRSCGTVQFFLVLAFVLLPGEQHCGKNVAIVQRNTF
jgi:ADP-ribose pyrophosphatase YjhB (NUDIX family)